METLISLKRCIHCGREVVKCPTLCTYHQWKHQDTGKHICDKPSASKATFAYAKE